MIFIQIVMISKYRKKLFKTKNKKKTTETTQIRCLGKLKHELLIR